MRITRLLPLVLAAVCLPLVLVLVGSLLVAALAVGVVILGGGWLLARASGERTVFPFRTLEQGDRLESRARAARMRSLAETARLLVATLEPSRIVEIVAARCLEGLEVGNVCVYVRDDEGDHLRLLTAIPPAARSENPVTLMPGEGIVGRSVVEQRPVWSPDALNDPSLWHRPETCARFRTDRPRALLAVPLVREQTVGAVLVSRPPGSTFTADEIEFLSTLTSQAAVALENARLFALEQRRRAQLEALVDTERELAAELNVERLLDLIIERAASRRGAL